ncbi:MAG: hypothetical protein GY710_20045 [Desulfobacteraceae bacterium]|nr:hypothetical protein [Desulfobacteraceae bacterium]
MSIVIMYQMLLDSRGHAFMALSNFAYSLESKLFIVATRDGWREKDLTANDLSKIFPKNKGKRKTNYLSLIGKSYIKLLCDFAKLPDEKRLHEPIKLRNAALTDLESLQQSRPDVLSRFRFLRTQRNRSRNNKALEREIQIAQAQGKATDTMIKEITLKIEALSLEISHLSKTKATSQ